MTFNCFTHHHHFKTRIAPGAPSQTSTMPCHAYREKRSTDFFPLLSSPRPPFLVYSEHAMPGPPKHVHDDIITLQRCESDSLQPANEKKNLQKTDMVFGWSGCPRTPPHTAAPPPQNRAHRWLTRPGTHSSQNARIRAWRIPVREETYIGFKQQIHRAQRLSLPHQLPASDVVRKQHLLSNGGWLA